MPTTRISEESHRILKELSAREGKTQQEIIEKALEAYRRRLFLESANAAYERLRNDDGTWQEEIAERRLWDTAGKTGGGQGRDE